MKTPDWHPPTPAGDALFVPAATPRADRPLLVLLPGAYGTPQDVVEQGLAAALAARQPSVDLLALPLDPFAITQGTALAALDEALAPWRARYAKLWLAGISLGALLMLAYLARGDRGVAGALAIAPYLGDRALEREVRAAGSPAVWAAAQRPDWKPAELERRVWYWLAHGGAHTLPLNLGLAASDRFYAGQRLAQSCWPDDRCYTTAGGHDWDAWRALWVAWLDQVALGEGGR